MSAVSEWIAREYFEAHGFFVRQPTKYTVAARSKHADEEVNLIIFNPQHAGGEFNTSELTWTGERLANVRCAMVGVRGWHTDRISPAVLEQNPEIYRFANDEVMAQMTEELASGPVAKILCLSGFAATPDLHQDALARLREEGIDGVMTFRTMLLELAKSVDATKNYEKSDLLQIMRILKAYDLLKDAQLDLFKN